MDTIYTLDYLRTLFNEMARSYDRVNYLTSFGFSQRFRHQFIQKACPQKDFVVCDLMCGRGECGPFILSGIGPNGTLLALDLSPGMLEGAKQRRAARHHANITTIEGNALATGFSDASVDLVLVAFGRKTLADDFRPGLARELYRLLAGNPANYRMLGIYTERFPGCGPIADALRDAGFDADLVSYFHGCATGIVARKPDTT